MGAVPALYLGIAVASDGDARDMRFYAAIYRNAASPGHQTFNLGPSKACSAARCPPGR